MFGYVCPKICELKVCEFENYKSYYCGLCKTVRKNYSNYAALFLSNDCVFMYILFSSVSDTKPELVKNWCILHGRKCKYTINDKGADYAAAIGVLLTAAKIEDDIRDTGRLKSRFARLLLRGAEKKAAARYPEAKKAIDDMTSLVVSLEREGSDDIDALSHSFACMLGKLFEAADEKNWETLYELGYNIGRYIYIIDAADDMQEDKEKGEYNVFLQRFGEDRTQAEKSAKFNLFMSLAQAKKAFDSLTIIKNQGILLNVITHGMTEKAQSVLKKEETASSEKRR
jgi:hypothetical protein